MMGFFDTFMEYFIIPVVMIICFVFVVCLILLPFAYYSESKRPDFSLKKDDWSCSKEYEYTTTMMIMVGKVMVPQIITHHDCIQWSHK